MEPCGNPADQEAGGGLYLLDLAIGNMERIAFGGRRSLSVLGVAKVGPVSDPPIKES